MPGTPHRALLAVFLPALFAFVAYAEPAPEKVHHFRATLVSKMEMKTDGKTQKVVSERTLDYTWTVKDHERVLSFDSTRFKMTVDDKPISDIFSSWEVIIETRDGRATEVKLRDLPQQLQNMLQDSFGTPVCKLQLNEKGDPIKRTVTVGPGTKGIVDRGRIATALLFHVPIRPGQDRWQADSELSFGEGGFAKGSLMYIKDGGDKEGQVFLVTGTLVGDGWKVPDTTLAYPKARYVVNGKQRYDSAQQEWISGQLVMDLFYQTNADDKPIGSAKGVVTISLEKLGNNSRGLTR